MDSSLSFIRVGKWKRDFWKEIANHSSDQGAYVNFT